MEGMQQGGDNWKKEGGVVKGARKGGESEQRLDVPL